MTLDLGPDDEVIIPSFTFTSVATAALRSGSTVRFADVDHDTLGLSLATVVPLVNRRTRAVIAVHYAGRARDLQDLRDYCDSQEIALIEDAAHALGGALEGKPLGSFGHLSCLSFHETKNLSCGEGGALVVNDPQLLRLARIVREKGTNRFDLFNGYVDKYTWLGPGSSFLLSDISAAILCAAIEDFPVTQNRRRSASQGYDAGLDDFIARTGFTRPVQLPNHLNSHHMYYMLASSDAKRDAILDHCRNSHIQAVFHYQSLARTPFGSSIARYADPTPVSDDVSRRLLRLPLYSDIPDQAVAAVIAAFDGWRP